MNAFHENVFLVLLRLTFFIIADKVADVFAYAAIAAGTDLMVNGDCGLSGKLSAFRTRANGLPLAIPASLPASAAARRPGRLQFVLLLVAL